VYTSHQKNVINYLFSLNNKTSSIKDSSFATKTQHDIDLYLNAKNVSEKWYQLIFQMIKVRESKIYDFTTVILLQSIKSIEHEFLQKYDISTTHEK